MITEKITCDHCKSEIERGYGFELRNIHIERKPGPFMERAAHFCTVFCLKLWAENAVVAAKEMQKAADSLEPHGVFTDKTAPGLALV